MELLEPTAVIVVRSYINILRVGPEEAVAAMPRDQTFRIFISSTFSDMTVERETLRVDVFPRLRDLCRTHGARFQAIDLRWGISEAASRDHQIMPVCFQEIARSRRVSPRLNFIALLGDRYGSYVLPPEIPAGEMARIMPRITDSKARELVSKWYICDNNAEPPTYCLSSRGGEDQEIWDKTKLDLRKALREGTTGLDLPEEHLLKYEASPTEQEIYRGVFKIRDAHQHAFAFFRSPLPTGSDPVPEDPENRRKLAALKRRLKSSLGRNNIVRFKDQKELASAAYDALERAILAELRSVTQQDPDEQEAEAHRNFGIERSVPFIGRPRELAAIQRAAEGGPRIPCCVHGVSGAGKTAVMAHLTNEFQKDDPRRVVVGRFIGATPVSSSAFSLFDGLSAEISRRYATVEAGASKTFRAAVERLHGSLALSRREKPLAVFLDAVDQFSDADFARKLDWLPASLPQYTSLIVSASPGECLDALRSKLPASQFVEVGDMLPSEGKELLSLWLRSADRHLQPGQLSTLMDHFGRCPVPLYLKLAFERIRALHSYDEVPALGSDLPHAIGALFDHLRQDAKHGRELVNCVLEYLCAARYGLTEDELLALLSCGGEKGEVLAEVWKRSKDWPVVAELPFVLWSRLYFDLEHYLTERSSRDGSLLGFYHRLLHEAAAIESRKRGGIQVRHAEIADYFAGQPNRYGGAVNIRKVTELPYQQSHAGPRHNVDETLTDLDFAEAKIGSGMLYDLIRDCDRALHAATLPGTTAIRKALAFELRGLSREPQLALQVLYNRLHFGQPPEKIAARLKSAIGKLDSQPLWLAAEAPLPGARVRVAFDINAAWQWLSFTTGVIAGASTDGELELRDIATGDLVTRRSLPGRGVKAIASTPGSGRIAWLDKDSGVRVEDSGVLLRVRRGDERLVWHPAAGLIAMREDGALVACDIDTGECVILAQHLPLAVSVLRLASRSQILLFAAGENDQLVGVVVPDAPSSNRAEFRFSGPPIVDADFDPETQRLLLLTQDACLRLIDLDCNRELAQLRYERLPAPIVRGRPERCALHLGASGCRAYFSTDHGHVASWDWTAGTVERLEDYMQVGDPDFVRIFEVSSDSGELFLSTPSWGAFWGTSERFSRSSTRHATSVSMCCFTRNGQVVCASRAGYTICWSTPRLELVFQSVYRGFTAIGPGYDTDNIIIGDAQGRIWSLSPRGESRDAAVIFGEAVLAVFGDSDGSAIAASGSGRVLRVPLWAGNESQILATSNGYRQQQRILRASKSGQCWSLRRDSRAGGQQTVLSLMEVRSREKVVLRTADLFSDAAVTEDGSIICLAGDSVRILRRRFWRCQTLYQRPTCVSHVAFTGCGNYIVVVPAGESRLEVWQLAEGLSTIGAIELQGRVTCLTTASDRIVAGLRSGEVLSLRLRGTTIGRSE